MDFDSLYKKHYKELYYFGIKQKELSADVSDVLQDVFTKFYFEIKSGKRIENPRAWLYKVLINHIRTNYRIDNSRASKHDEISKSAQLSYDTHESYIMNEQQKIIVEGIMQMPEREKNILLLYHNGFSYLEISDIMNMNYTSVGTYIARAVEKLKTIIKVQYNELFD
jgi:RNA polymerase sigma-70 factor, ECF subfamily